MRTHNTTCDVCGDGFYLKPSYKKASKTGKFTCSKSCLNKLRSLLAKEKLEKQLGINNLAVWLQQKYIEEGLSIRQISQIMYNTDKNNRSVSTFLERYNIPIRKGSEAVKNQWTNNEERRQKQRDFANRKLVTGKGREKLKEIMKTKEYRLKSSLAKIGEKNPMYGVCGESHPHWNPERTHDLRVIERKQYKDARWRKGVFQRDEFICQSCRKKGYSLVAHHMDSWHWSVEGRYDVDNGITLCESCHKRFHGEYGYKNNTKAQTHEFLNKNKQITSLL